MQNGNMTIEGSAYGQMKSEDKENDLKKTLLSNLDHNPIRCAILFYPLHYYKALP
jgi:hypothetical protein